MRQTMKRFVSSKIYWTKRGYKWRGHTARMRGPKSQNLRWPAVSNKPENHREK